MADEETVHAYLVRLSFHMLEAYMLGDADEGEAASLFHAGLSGLRMAEDLSPELATMGAPK